MSNRSKALTLAVVAVYACIMIGTNHIYTILDDEGTIIAVAGHPILPTIKLFLFGGGQHEHPPASDILLHVWLLATNYSLSAVRIFANIFYIGALLLAALAARKIGGASAYWVTLATGFLWPFAFQYGRITGWYCFCMFLVSWLTWLYLRLLEESGFWPWATFAAASVLLVWTNYFGVVILLLLLFDCVLLHRRFAVECAKPLLTIGALVIVSFLPLLRVVSRDIGARTIPAASHLGLKMIAATVGYTTFSLFGSVAVAPWFLPLSIPVAAAAIALCASMFYSAAQRWLVYFILAVVFLELSGHLDVKRILFLSSWLFLAAGVAASDSRRFHSKVAWGALAVLIIAGWIGIISGNHYATTNLREPWEKVAVAVAKDARRGATVVSENPSFFLYVNYQLGLGSQTGAARSTYLGESLYRAHGYRIFEPVDWQPEPEQLRGEVVVVNGPGAEDEVERLNELSRSLQQRCKKLGEYQAAPDPAASLKRTFASRALLTDYRTQVDWYGCPINQ